MNQRSSPRRLEIRSRPRWPVTSDGRYRPHAHNLTRFITRSGSRRSLCRDRHIVPNRQIQTTPARCFDSTTAPVEVSGSRKPRLELKIVCAFVSAEARDAGMDAGISAGSDVQAAARTFAESDSKRTRDSPTLGTFQPISCRSSRRFPGWVCQYLLGSAEAIAARRAGKQPDPLALFSRIQKMDCWEYVL